MIQCHNCPREFNTFQSLMQHRRAKHYRPHYRKTNSRSRPFPKIPNLNSFSLTMDKLARLMEAVLFISKECPTQE